MGFNNEVSVGDWFITLLLISIPIVNIILLLIWAFSDHTNVNKQNFAKAALLWMIIPIALIVLFSGCSVMTIFGFMG